MTGWDDAYQDRARTIAARPAAQAPATLGEIWRAEWNANGLDTAFGVNKPFNDAYQELFDRTAEITGKPIPELARERGLNFFGGGLGSKIDVLGRIVDSLPDDQSKILSDYKDVYGRARSRAADTMREAEEVGARTYGITGHATAFAAGVARQAVDPVNLATMPIDATNPAIGAGKKAISLWLGKQFAIGAGVQAAQEPYIQLHRGELGLPNTSFENIVQAGIGQAGLSALFRGASAAWRHWRGTTALQPGDMQAAAHVAERDAVMDQQAGVLPGQQDGLHVAGRALAGEAPLSGIETNLPSKVSDYAGDQAIFRPDGSRFTARYAVVERSALIVSHDLDGNANPDFPADLQPRDRERSASRLWVNENAARLQPELLGHAPTARDGAPVVGKDHIVESGNGRVMLIEQAYRSHPERAQAYRDFLDAQGFDVAAFKEPVLVRIRQEDLTFSARKAFTDESNTAATAALSSTERAGRDARALDDGLLTLWQGGDIGRAENTPFVRRFSDQVLTAPERGAFMVDGGGLSKEGAARIEAALVAKGWQREAIVRALAEERDGTSKGILQSLSDTAATAARLRAALEDGRVGADMDVLKPVLDAFELVDRARRTGQKPAALFDQIDMERGAVPAETRAAAELFFRNADMTLPAGRETIATRLDWALNKALTYEGGSLFGDSLDTLAVLKAARLASEQLEGLDLARAMTEAAGDAQVKPAVKSMVDDPATRQAEQLLAEHGDVQLHLDEDKAKTTSARQVLADIAEDRKAANELADCIDRTGGRIEDGQ